jgi:hypothetical protein
MDYEYFSISRAFLKQDAARVRRRTSPWGEGGVFVRHVRTESLFKSRDALISEDTRREEGRPTWGERGCPSSDYHQCCSLLQEATRLATQITEADWSELQRGMSRETLENLFIGNSQDESAGQSLNGR